MTWTVVEFLETHEVEAVPSSWLYEDETTQETKCFWPPYEADKVEKEIKNNTEVNTCWPLYEVRIFKNSTFGKIYFLSILFIISHMNYFHTLIYQSFWSRCFLGLAKADDYSEVGKSISHFASYHNVCKLDILFQI